MTHEEFIQKVRTLAVERLPEAERERLLTAKLVYGKGVAGLRGITCYGAWNNGKQGDDFIEVCAQGEESPTQLAGTTIHEMGHCLAGPGTGHGPEWKAACERLGLRRPRAQGHQYLMAGFDPAIRRGLAALTKPLDGAPGFTGIPGALFRLRPCSMGYGTRGGKSRGPGSGSRLRKWVCDCGIIARVSSDDFQAHCDRCGSAFKREGGDPLASLVAALTG
jgi:hypothetical protein